MGFWQTKPILLLVHCMSFIPFEIPLLPLRFQMVPQSSFPPLFGCPFDQCFATWPDNACPESQTKAPSFSLSDSPIQYVSSVCIQWTSCEMITYFNVWNFPLCKKIFIENKQILVPARRTCCAETITQPDSQRQAQLYAFWNNFTCLYCSSFHNSTKREPIRSQVFLASIHVCLERT